MKKATILTQAQISYARELYTEHGFTVDAIANELGCRASTVTRYLLGVGVEIKELDPMFVEYRKVMIETFKTWSEDFSDLEGRNYDYILKIWEEVRNA